MADEEKPNEEVAQATPETTTEVPEEAKQEELPLVAGEEQTEGDKKEPEVKAEEPKVEEKPDWRERELKAKHRQLQEAKRRETELQRELEATKALAAKFNQSTDKAVIPNVVPADEVEKRAQELIAQRQYLDSCNKAAQKGEQIYGQGWKDAVSNLEVLGGFDQDTMNGLLATDDPAKVLFELGKNPDHYHRIMELPRERRIIEMEKLATQPAQLKKVSDAPPPVNPVGGRAAPAAATLRDDMDDDKWFATRRAQRRVAWEQKNGVRR